MLKKNKKLTTTEFQKTFKNGTRKHIGPFLFVLEKKQISFKVGISVPKKIYKNATDRNHIKRKIINFLQKENLTLSKTHLLIILKQKIGTPEFKKSLIALFTD